MPRRFITTLVATVLGVMLPGGLAFAHDPIIFAEAQTTPGAGPLLPDGTVSFALYGTLMRSGDSRGATVRFAAGDTLIMSLLVPALEPERSLDAASLPTLTLRAPDGSTRVVPPGEAVTFDEPFTSTSYVRYIQLSEPAQAGEYGVTVTAVVPARFTLSVGTKEQFGTPVENVPNRDLGVGGVMTWYATPPPVDTAPVDTAPVDSASVTTAAATTTTTTATVSPSSTEPATTSAATTVPGGSSSGDDSGVPVAAIVAVLAVLLASVVAVVAISRRRAPTPR
ncbi:MAG: hypothetical protein RLZ14_1232 [Actinomycetota bacterium]|jgi:hypothetical protein